MYLHNRSMTDIPPSSTTSTAPTFSVEPPILGNIVNMREVIDVSSIPTNIVPIPTVHNFNFKEKQFKDVFITDESANIV